MAESSRKLFLQENTEKPTKKKKKKKKTHREVVSHHHHFASTPILLRSLSNKMRVVKDEVFDLDSDSNTDGDGDGDGNDTDPAYRASHHDGQWNPSRESSESSDSDAARELEEPIQHSEIQQRFYETAPGESSSSTHDSIKPSGQMPSNYLRSLAKYVMSQGLQSEEGLEDQKRYSEEGPGNIMRPEMEEMRSLSEEKRESFSDYLFATESKSDASAQKIGHKQGVYSRIQAQDMVDSFNATSNAETNLTNLNSTSVGDDQDFKDMMCGCPSKVLRWLGGEGKDSGSDKYISISEHRVMNLLRTLKETGKLQARLNSNSLNPSLGMAWVPTERLKEVEKRSSIVEEQIKQCLNLLSGVEDENEDTNLNERIRNLLSKNNMIKRHFSHMKKFAEERQKDLRKRHVLAGTKPGGPRILHTLSKSVGSSEKEKMDMQEHENHKKCVGEIQAMYDELLSFLTLENSKRLEIERKNQQIFGQIKKQTDQLKRAENVIKHTNLLSTAMAALKGSDSFGESINLHSQSKNNTLSEAISQAYDKAEFEEVEKALIQEGKSRGLSDVDLYSERKVMGENQETCWEYRHMHLDFNKAQKGVTASHENELESFKQNLIFQRSNIDSPTNIMSRDRSPIIRSSAVEQRNSNTRIRNLAREDGRHDWKDDHIYQSNHHHDTTARETILETNRERFDGSHKLLEHDKKRNVNENMQPSIATKKLQRSPDVMVQSLLRMNAPSDEERIFAHDDESLHTSLRSMSPMATKHMDLPNSKAKMSQEVSHDSKPVLSDSISSLSNNIKNVNGIEDVNTFEGEWNDAAHTLKEASARILGLHRQVKWRCKLLLVQIVLFFVFVIWCMLAIFRWHVNPPPT